MFIDPEPQSAVQDRIYRALESMSISASSTGSKANTLVTAFLEERAHVLRDTRSVVSQALLKDASGGFLDLLGQDFFNNERIEEGPASVTDIDANLILSVDTGSLSDYLPIDGGRYYVPTGISIKDVTEQIEYTTDRRIYVEEFANRVYISATSVQNGVFANVPAGALTSIEIDGVEVTNLAAITNGSEVESDNNYRFRLNNSYIGNEDSNETALVNAALSIPGVSDVVSRPRVNGPGTVQLLIIPEGSSVSQSVLDLVRDAVSTSNSEETVVFVDAPTYVSIRVEYSFSGRALTEEERTRLTLSIQSIAKDDFANVGFDGILDPSLSILPALSTIPGIIGRVQKLCIDGRVIPSKVYQLGQDELSILDITQPEPIKVFF